jgi:hypothetical protein
MSVSGQRSTTTPAAKAIAVESSSAPSALGMRLLEPAIPALPLKARGSTPIGPQDSEYADVPILTRAASK